MTQSKFNWLHFLPQSIRSRLVHRPNFQAILSNSSWLFADKVLRMGVGLFVSVWLTRYLGPDQFGLWSFAIAFAALFGPFASLGLDSIVIRELVKNPERQNELLGSAFVLKLIGSIVALLISLFAILLMRGGDILTIYLVGLSAVGFIFQSISVIDFYFQSKVQSRYTVCATNGAFILITVVKIALILTKAPIIYFAFAGLAESTLTAAFLILAYRANHHSLVVWSIKWLVMKELFEESWPLFLAGLSVVLYMKVDMVMLQQMLGSREVGIYAAATKLSEVWYFLPTVIISSVSPLIIKSYEKDKRQYISKLRKLYFLMAWLAIGISLPLSLLSDQIIYTFYGAEFAKSAPVLAMHLWASVAVFLGMASSQFLLVERLQKISFYRTLIGLVCNVTLNLILIPEMGAMGAAIATVASYFVALFSLIFFKVTRSHMTYLLLAPFSRN